MDPQELAELRKSLGLDKIETLLTDNAEKTAREEAERLKALKEKQEKERVVKLVQEAGAEQAEKLKDAIKLMGVLEEKLAANDVASFAKTLESLQSEITSKNEEIAQILASREGKNQVAFGVSKALGMDAIEERMEKAVLIAALTRKSMEDTTFGAETIKAVNDSSSIEVSSEAYETVFSNRILRDVQKLLVVGAMFNELPMGTKKLTMQIEAQEAGTATWVGAANFGKPGSTGNEITTALTDITFDTYKLAAKAYMTDETEEDAVTALLPIIRRHLIEAHVNAIEAAFMGDTTAAVPNVNMPTGLLRYAAIDGKVVESAATADGATPVTGKMIHTLRRSLGLKGLKLAGLKLVVSMDAYYDLIEDDNFMSVDKVGADNAILLQGQVGRIYGMPVVVSSFFPAKADDAPFCAIVYSEDFIVPRQRLVTVERDREAGNQRDAYYVTQRLNLQRYFDKNVVVATYASAP